LTRPIIEIEKKEYLYHKIPRTIKVGNFASISDLSSGLSQELKRGIQNHKMVFESLKS
jgi:hypothetical protein